MPVKGLSDTHNAWELPVSTPFSVSEDGTVPSEQDVVDPSALKKRSRPASPALQEPPTKKLQAGPGAAAPVTSPSLVPSYATLMQRASNPTDITAMNEAPWMLRLVEGSMSAAEFTHLAATYANSYLRGYTVQLSYAIDTFAEILERGLEVSLSPEQRNAFHQALVGVCDDPKGMILALAWSDFSIYAIHLDEAGALNLLSHLAKGVSTSNPAASVTFEELAKDLRDSHESPTIKAQAEAVMKATKQYRRLRTDYASTGGFVLDEATRALARIYDLEAEGVEHGEYPATVSINMARCNAAMQRVETLAEPMREFLADADKMMQVSETIREPSQVDLLTCKGNHGPTLDVETTPLRLSMRVDNQPWHSFAVRASNAGAHATLRLINSGYGTQYYHQTVLQCFKRAMQFSDGHWKRSQSTGNCSSKSYRLVESEGRDPQVYRAIREVRRAFFGFAHDDTLDFAAFFHPTNVERAMRDAVRAKIAQRVLNDSKQDLPVDMVNTTFCVDGIPKKNLPLLLKDVVAAAQVSRPVLDASCAAIYNAMCAHTDIDCLAAAAACDVTVAETVAARLQQLGYVMELGPEGHRKLFVTKAFVDALKDATALIRDLDATLECYTLAHVWEGAPRRMVEHLANAAMQRGYLVPAAEPTNLSPLLSVITSETVPASGT